LPLSGQVRPASSGSEAAEQRQEAPAAQPNAQDVRNAVDKLNRTLSALDTQARFLVNEELNQIVVQVLDVRTNTVIKQIPPQQVLDAVAAMLRLVGLLVDGKG
jgi:flagellar protein FlaG